EQKKPWSSRGMEGVDRFLSRVWRLFTGEADTSNELSAGFLDPDVLKEPDADKKRNSERIIHSTIKKVTEDIERLSFNTAISSMMIFVNEFFNEKRIGRFGTEAFIKLLSPFAPHIAEELWQRFQETVGMKASGTGSILDESWPEYDEQKTAADEIEVVFQVNGKLRGRANVAPDIAETDLKSIALENDGVMRAMEGKEVRKIIVVKGKLVNIVI
ncbi:MAG: class I tRNA ligase family protein, partial [Leptospiraceae bacterium]|nr:class I tRNA ligase family protein [Leptospiraceae bacterium]